MQLPTLFNKRVLLASQRHAVKAFPNEAVGIVHKGKYTRLTNRHCDPLNHFAISIEEINKVTDYDAVEAVIHSHNTELHSPSPSYADMKSQLAHGKPWGIQLVNSNGAGNIVWWGPGVPVLPFEGRPYIFGVLDCYTIVRDYFKTKHNITLRDYAREDYYWEQKNPVDMYSNHVREEGFVKVDRADMRPGDLLLVKINCNIPNHAIIYLGGDSGLHHPTGTISRIDSISRYIDTERNFFHSLWRHKELIT